jgi:hypothetical protein
MQDPPRTELTLVLAFAVSSVLTWALVPGGETLRNSEVLRDLLALGVALGMGAAIAWALFAGRQGLALFVAVGVVAVTAWSVIREDGSGSFEFNTGLAPAEYLYLDNGRVLSYLSQVRGGLSENEKRSIKVTESLNAGIEEGPAKVGASRSRERFVEEVVTPTAASNFFRLYDELEGAEASGTYFHVLRHRQFDPEEYAEVNEGDFVAFRDVTLNLPAYAADYYFVKRFGSLDPGEASARHLDCLRLTEGELEKVKKWVKPFGRNPRMTLTAEVEFARDRKADEAKRVKPKRVKPKRVKGKRVKGKRAKGKREKVKKWVKLMLPVEYASLADEQSLLRGARLTILGKVVRKDQRYQDAPTLTTFGPRLRKMPKFLVAKKGCVNRRVGLKEGGRARRRRREEDKAEERRRVRARLIRKLRKGTTLRPKGLVIIPVAIYSTRGTDAPSG